MSLDYSNKIFTFWFQITDQCNLQCEYCYIKKNTCNPNLKKLLMISDKIIETINKNKIEIATIKISGGEPFYNKNILIKIIEYIRSKNNRIFFNIVTNGILLNEKDILLLSKYNIQYIVSLDDISLSGNMQRFKSKIVLNKILKNILLIKKLNQYVCVNSVVTKKNINKLPEIANFFVKNQIIFNFTFFKPRSIDDLKFIPSINSFEKNYKKVLKILFTNKRYFDFENKMFDYLRFFIHKSTSCYAGTNFLAVDREGYVFDCAMNENYKKINILKSVDIISFFRKNIKNKNNVGIKNVNDDPYCKDCQIKHYCGGGCYYVKNKVINNKSLKYIYCDIYKTILNQYFTLKRNA